MKYEFMRVQSSINYLKTVSWYRSQHLKTIDRANIVTGLYKSKNFLVVNKPYDLVMYNFTKNKENNLLDMIADIYPFHYDTRIQGGFRVLHRLDR
jgi:23S rRNA-/tRNA-specific pseudouridylate synthase